LLSTRPQKSKETISKRNHRYQKIQEEIKKKDDDDEQKFDGDPKGYDLYIKFVSNTPINFSFSSPTPWEKL
jgi:hypothetical protein